MNVRPPSIAGTFYPADVSSLNRQLDRSWAARQPLDVPPPKAMIAPHAGIVYSGPIAATAYASVEQAAAQIERVVLLGPSHHFGLHGFAIPSVTAFRTPLGEVELDSATLQRLARRPDVTVSDSIHGPEHSLEIQLPFMQRALGVFQLVPVVVGGVNAASCASLLADVWGGAETLVVISSDLSHFLTQASATAHDAQTTRIIEELDADAVLSADACGRHPIAGLLLQARRRGMTMRTVDVRTSADTAGDPSRVVGYGSYLFWEADADAQARPPAAADPANSPSDPLDRISADDRAALSALAWRSIGDGLQRGAWLSELGARHAMPVDVRQHSERLQRHGASFVTLHRRGELRGCIGTTRAWQPLAQDVVQHAFAAAFRDPRFAPLPPEEFMDLDIELSVLGTPRDVQAADRDALVALLQPGVHGLILSAGRHAATFLPSVWDGLPDPYAFIAHLERKAGIGSGPWPSNIRTQLYEVQKWSAPRPQQA